MVSARTKSIFFIIFYLFLGICEIPYYNDFGRMAIGNFWYTRNLSLVSSAAICFAFSHLGFTLSKKSFDERWFLHILMMMIFYNMAILAAIGIMCVSYAYLFLIARSA